MDTMSEKMPVNNPEKKETLDDNARKFTVDTLDTTFLEENNAYSFVLTVDWLETGEDDEKKVAHKKFDSGDVQILLISKVMKDGSRTSEKEAISEEDYKGLLASSVLHLEKRRYEFTYTQGSTSFAVKYDEFGEGKLRVLEVDASSEEERNSFNPSEFPVALDEVTGDMQYYGYRIASIV